MRKKNRGKFNFCNFVSARKLLIWRCGRMVSHSDWNRYRWTTVWNMQKGNESNWILIGFVGVPGLWNANERLLGNKFVGDLWQFRYMEFNGLSLVTGMLLFFRLQLAKGKRSESSTKSTLVSLWKAINLRHYKIEWKDTTLSASSAWSNDNEKKISGKIFFYHFSNYGTLCQKICFGDKKHIKKNFFLKKSILKLNCLLMSQLLFFFLLHL
jgi:hypothetical protein